MTISLSEIKTHVSFDTIKKYEVTDNTYLPQTNYFLTHYIQVS